MSRPNASQLATPDTKVAAEPITTARIQRKCACGTHASGGGQCEACRKKRIIQRHPGNAAEPLTPAILPMLNQSGRPLDPAVRAFMEPRFGRDFSQVRVHTDAQASQSARALNALAYTVGQDVIFAQGHYQPGTTRGQRLLAHELAHTIQQRNVRGVPQTKLEIDPVGSPLEAAADRAADAVIGGGPIPALTAIGPTISREAASSSSTEERGQCTATGEPSISLSMRPPGDALSTGETILPDSEEVSANARRVRTSSGRRFLVTRIPWSSTDDVPAWRASATPGADRQDVWLDVTLCRGNTEGTIRVGANVPGEAIQLILNTITSGGDARSAWAQATITPTVSGTIRSRTWRLDLTAHTTLDSSGHPTGAGGGFSVTFDTPIGPITAGVEAQSERVGRDPFGGFRVVPSITIPLERPTPPPPCTRQRFRSGYTYRCQEERDVTRPGTQEVTTTNEHVYNLFFIYARDRFVPDAQERRNPDARAGIRADLGPGGGFQVARIEGWASPEGPMGPGRGGFVGNDVLSQQRANVTRTLVQGLCGSGDCFQPGAEVVGMGERLDPTDDAGQRQDVSGTPLEQHVDQTFPTDPGESTVRSPGLMRNLGRTRSLRARSERIYEQLRRSIVTLRRRSTRSERCGIPGVEASGSFDCPAGVRRAAFPGPASTP